MWFKRQTWIAIVALIKFLKVLSVSCGKRNECTRPKEERRDCLSCRVNLRFERSIGNIVSLAKCKNQTVEEDIEQLYIHQAVRTTIGIGASVWKNAEEGRIIWSNDSQLKICDWMSRIKRNLRGPVTIILERNKNKRN